MLNQNKPLAVINKGFTGCCYRFTQVQLNVERRANDGNSSVTSHTIGFFFTCKTFCKTNSETHPGVSVILFCWYMSSKWLYSPLNSHEGVINDTFAFLFLRTLMAIFPSSLTSVQFSLSEVSVSIVLLTSFIRVATKSHVSQWITLWVEYHLHQECVRWKMSSAS